MKKVILGLSTFCLTTVAFCQINDVPTNAFDDLTRKGIVLEENSPMRKLASEQQLSELLKRTPKTGYFCFTENRENSTRIFNSIPEVWAVRDVETLNLFSDKNVAPNEYYVYQIALYAVENSLEGITVKFSDLKNSVGSKISSSNITCFNLEGNNLKGEKFSKVVNCKKGEVQPLWIGVDIPYNAKGEYKGSVEIEAKNAKSTTIDIVLNVSGDAIENHGFNNGSKLSRLAWLNSQIAVSQEPTAPYTPVTVFYNEIGYLGGNIKISEQGLPSSITTLYSEMNEIDGKSKNKILADPMTFEIETENGVEIFKTKNVEINKLSNGAALWNAELDNKNFKITILGLFEFDGSADVSIEVNSIKDINIKDIRLITPFTHKSSKYSVGLNQTGGVRKQSEYVWNWDTTKHQDCVWIGDINAGLNLKFKDENYVRPLVNIYYALGRLNMPESWGNNKKGGIKYKEDYASNLNLTAFSGERQMKKGDKLYYNFEMLITPVKPLDFVTHITERYHHSNSDESQNYIEEAKEAGATRINIHHKKEMYPYINYPYYDECIEDFKTFSNKAKAEGLDLGVYYTTRELTVKVPEIWALRSMGSEIIHDGPGKDAKTLIHPNGPNEWLVKNFTTNFIPAWYNAFSSGKYKGEMDISVITTPDSRWNNYYLEGLNWMVKNLDLKGVYIDDSALDKETLRRARRIIDMDKQKRMIDIHSWNHFNEWAGYANSLHMYLDLLPYVDRIWIGEGFSENNTLDFWMVEMAGIPYGQLSETLDAHNIFKGLVFAATPRYVWSGDPRPIWKMYDSFKMEEAKMYGYWITNKAVDTSNENLPATVYVNHNTKEAIVAIASWSSVQTEGKLSFSPSILGFEPKSATVIDLGKHQTGGEFDINSTFTIEPKKGLVLLIK